MSIIFSVEKHLEPVILNRKTLIEQVNDSFEKALDVSFTKEQRREFINEVVVNTVSLAVVSTIEAIENAKK
ncbi:hypothetical protein KBI51_09575 [Aerococcaceae bacterium zg-ZUI334]|uniref:hypothetical protein n=1 Tax=Aerococcaceae bacterium zg-252 TaxID=2796928 RepID=UPI001B9B6AA9|nr:hypothetical protein [Aerococcaceae bacterium zg-ZUI334]